MTMTHDKKLYILQMSYTIVQQLLITSWTLHQNSLQQNPIASVYDDQSIQFIYYFSFPFFVVAQVYQLKEIFFCIRIH